MPRPITLKAIAARAGKDISTVSLALRNDPRISIPTRDRIRAIASEMGYVPNPALRALVELREENRLATYHSTLAYILPIGPNGETIGSHDPLLESARTRANELGHELEILTTREYPDATKLHRLLEARGIQGLILGREPLEAAIPDLPWHHYAVVCAGTGLRSQPFHTISGDPFRSIRLLVRKAKEHGYQRIGLAPGHHTPLIYDDELRIGAALFSQGSMPGNLPPFTGSFTDQPGLRAYVRRYRPDFLGAFFSQAKQELEQAGFAIPEDFAFAALNLHPHRTIHAGLAGIQSFATTIGRVAIEWLDLLVRTNQRGIPDQRQFIQVEPVWHEGATCPDRPTNSID